MGQVLIVDDNAAVRTALVTLLAIEDIDTVEADSPAAALAACEASAGDFDAVIQDMNFTADTVGGEEGMQLFSQLRARWPELPIVLMTAWTHLEQAVQLVREGAADYLAKPWDNERLRTTLRNLLALSQARRNARESRSELNRQRSELVNANLCGAIIESPAMIDLVRLALKVAPSQAPVLISGPNGAGKERIAEIIHANSRAADKPLIALNCGALPSELIEAELFGAEAGAYTGASKSREGKFEAAHGSTLLLDEIGNLSLSGQMKLLRVLETGEIERLGSNKTRRVQVRVISATNADLPEMIAQGKFREDLYYRLNVIELVLPGLSARRADILPIARSLLDGKQRLSAAAEAALLAHNWPGNVRELRNAMTRASLLSKSPVIEPEDFQMPKPTAAGAVHRSEAKVAAEAPPTLAESSAAQIEAALAMSKGVISDAAAVLGLSRQALYRRMERFGIPKPGENG